MPVWLTWIFSIVIILVILAWIGLSIYQKIRQIQGKKKSVNCKCKCSTFYMNENLIFKLNS